MFAALDVTTTDVEELKRMLGRWAAIAARITAGKLVSDSPVREEQPPFDTGESMDLGPHSLIITVGCGPSLFDGRFGLAGKMPTELTRRWFSTPSATWSGRPGVLRSWAQLGGEEFTPVDYSNTDDSGNLIGNVNAHIRLASPEQNNGIKLLRRGYNYTDGQNPDTGKLAAGLFFIAFQRDPQAQFKVIQSRLGRSDLLNGYIAHIGGGLWACPPGVSGPGDWFGKSLSA